MAKDVNKFVLFVEGFGAGRIGGKCPCAALAPSDPRLGRVLPRLELGRDAEQSKAY